MERQVLVSSTEHCYLWQCVGLLVKGCLAVYHLMHWIQNRSAVRVSFWRTKQCSAGLLSTM